MEKMANVFLSIGLDTRSSDRPVGTAGKAHVVKLSGRLRKSRLQVRGWAVGVYGEGLACDGEKLGSRGVVRY